MPGILIQTPAPLDSQKGNAVSARRIAELLAAAGLQARAIHWQPGDAMPDSRCLIALHAVKSADAVEEFRKRLPGRPVVVVITGTDLHDEQFRQDRRFAANTQAADAIVVSNDAAAAELPAKLREKSAVIWQSVRGPLPRHDDSVFASRHPLRCLLAGHLREVKLPFLAAEALASLPGADICVDAFGSALSPEMRSWAELAMSREPRFLWHGEISRGELLDRMASAHLLLNTSLSEGGSNAVSEAIAIGLPVLASRISGNQGLLGSGYGGFFSSGDAACLAGLMSRAQSDERFLTRLAGQVRERSALLAPENETAGWMRLLANLGVRGLDDPREA